MLGKSQQSLKVIVRKVVKTEVRLIQQKYLLIDLYQVIHMGHTNQR